MRPDDIPTEPKLFLGDISTSWRRLHDPLRFVMTYGPAVRAYLLAAKASERSGQPLTPEAFRKQLSLARRLFAELIAAEVRQTLDGATDEQVQDELADLDLLR